LYQWFSNVIASESPGRLVETQMAGPHPKTGLQELPVYILPGNAVVADVGNQGLRAMLSL
jgi:hypothetical protein